MPDVRPEQQEYPSVCRAVARELDHIGSPVLVSLADEGERVQVVIALLSALAVHGEPSGVHEHDGTVRHGWASVAVIDGGCGWFPLTGYVDVGRVAERLRVPTRMATRVTDLLVRVGAELRTGGE